LIDAARDESPLRVIITVAPGARQGIYAKLEAHGAKVNASFTIIEALAAELPPGLIRSLAKDKDVVSISTDAMVKGDGVSGVTGTAVGSAFTLRRTLGLASVERVTRLGATSASYGKGSTATLTYASGSGSNRLMLVGVAMHPDGTPRARPRA